LSFASEKDLIRAFVFFIAVNDIDCIGGHNSGGFDIPFIRDRIKYLGMFLLIKIRFSFFSEIKNLPSFGRMRSKKDLYIQTNINKGRKTTNVFIAGRLHIDTMRWEQEIPGARDMSLNGICAKYLKQETKYDMDMTIMTDLQKTSYGRRRIGKYCIKDSDLVWQLISKFFFSFLVIKSMCVFPLPLRYNLYYWIGIECIVFVECLPTNIVESITRC